MPMIGIVSPDEGIFLRINGCDCDGKFSAWQNKFAPNAKAALINVRRLSSIDAPPNRQHHVASSGVTGKRSDAELAPWFVPNFHLCLRGVGITMRRANLA